MLVKLLVSLVPVFIFLFMLLYLDSLKLVSTKILLACLGWGVVSAAASYFLNTLLMGNTRLDFDTYSGLVAPVVEEVLKFTLLWILVKSNKIGFMIDATIYGFAIGASFSLVENIFYLFTYSEGESNLMVWIIRGFGTAIMHGGATAIFGMICMSALNRQSSLGVATIYGALVAVLVHGIFNQFLVSPFVSMVVILLIVPMTIVTIFNLNEKSIRSWLELEFDSEATMLRMIRKGVFSQTKTGSYLVSLRDHYPPEVVVDMYCYISLYLELSIKAKSMMMLKENNLVIPPDPSLPGKLQELKVLRQHIGRGGCLAIAPVFRMNRKDLWKLTSLAHK